MVSRFFASGSQIHGWSRALAARERQSWIDSRVGAANPPVSQLVNHGILWAQVSEFRIRDKKLLNFCAIRRKIPNLRRRSD